MAKGILLLIFLMLGNIQAQFCDPELQTQQGDPYAYQEREPSSVNRCEGVYLQEVASSAISLTSFTTSYDPFDEATESLYLSWLSPSEAMAKPVDKVHLRADSQVFKLYYRMDTVWPPNSNDSAMNTDTPIFKWPANVLTNLQLDKDGLGISAWLPVQFPPDASDGVERDIYLPLRVSTSEKIKTSTNYSVVVMPSAELSTISYQVLPTTLNGYADDKADSLESGKLEGYYSSGQPVTIDFNLDTDVDKGIYYLEIEVTRTNSKKSHLEIWFYHDGS